MSSDEVRKLNMGMLREENNKLKEQERHVVKGGEFFVDKVFVKTKRFSLLDEFAKNYREMSGKTELDDAIFTTYIYLLALKYFTTIDVPDKIEDQVDFVSMLIDTEYLSPIIETLPENEMDKILEDLNMFTEKLIQFGEDLNAEIGNLNIDNAEIMKILNISEDDLKDDVNG